MRLRRTILVFLLSLATAIAPFASAAMAKSCGMASEMNVKNSGSCPCHDSMPGCGTMQQCRTALGCASQCFTTSGVLTTIPRAFGPVHDALKLPVSLPLSSLALEPPAPPPRA